MKKRFVVQRIRLVPENGKDWLGNPVEKTEETSFLCKDDHLTVMDVSLAETVTVPKIWTQEPKEVRYFRTEALAEKAAFAVVVAGRGKYMGNVSVLRVPGRTDLLKVRRRNPDKVNTGRWPHSDGRKRREAQEKH